MAKKPSLKARASAEVSQISYHEVHDLAVNSWLAGWNAHRRIHTMDPKKRHVFTAVRKLIRSRTDVAFSRNLLALREAFRAIEPKKSRRR